MKLFTWTGTTLAILSICGACYGTATDAVVEHRAWGLAGDEWSAEDIPIRDEAAQFTATNLMDLISGMMDGTESFGAITVTGALTTGSLTYTTADTEITATALEVSGATELDGGLTMDTNKFTVDDGSGNTGIAGTLAVTGTTTLTGAVGSAASITLGGGADLIGSSTSDIDIDSVFTVAGATGNTLVAGTFEATGASTLTGAVGAAAHITLGAGADLVGSSTSDINMDAFDVAGSTGNTTVGGTLAVTGTTAFTGAVTANNGITLGAGDDLIGSSTSDLNLNGFDVAGATGNLVITGTITDSTDDVDIDDSCTISGATALSSTLAVAGASTFNNHVNLGAGDDLVGSSTSDINMNEFDVAGSSGNTTIGGTLAVTGITTFTGAVTSNGGITLGDGDDLIGSATSDLTMNTSKFTVAGASGNVAVNTNKFTIAGATGNTLVAGTFDSTGAAALASTLDVAGAADFAGTTEFADNTCTITDATGAIKTDSSLTVGTTSTLTGNIAIAGTISDATDDVDIDDSCTISGATALSSTLDVAGAADFAGTTEFADNTCTITDATGAIATDAGIIVGTTLAVTGTSTLTGNVAVVGTISDATDDVDIDDSVTISGTLAQTGIATFAATAVFNGGQTRKHTLTGNEITVDGTTGPTLGVLGTSGQSQINAYQFDANPNATGDDYVYLRWRVPNGYVVGSARLNITFSYSTAETDGDDVNFDFSVLVLTPGSGAAGGTAYDAAGVAGDHVDVDLVNGDGDEGKLMEQQIDIEITAIAVGDELLIAFWVDEDQCDLAVSGTVDVHQYEIEWESTE